MDWLWEMAAIEGDAVEDEHKPATRMLVNLTGRLSEFLNLRQASELNSNLRERGDSLILLAQYDLERAHEHEAKGRADLALPLAQEALKIYERLQHRDLAEVRELVERLTNSTNVKRINE
jgi:hypothetical protein